MMEGRRAAFLQEEDQMFRTQVEQTEMAWTAAQKMEAADWLLLTSHEGLFQLDGTERRLGQRRQEPQLIGTEGDPEERSHGANTSNTCHTYTHTHTH